MTLIEREKIDNGFTVEKHYDDAASNPRTDYDHLGLFLGFPHRSYEIGDETFDPSDARVTCTTCDGEGRVVSLTEGVEDGDAECPVCYGDGVREPKDMDEMHAYLRAEHDAVGPILTVGMIDHSGVAYYIGGGAHWCDPGGWDSGTCGFIFATEDSLKALGHETQPSDDDLKTWLTGEIAEYSAWANGEVYGYMIYDRNDDLVDSCWGFIGDAFEEALQEAIDGLEVPEKLHSVRLTHSEAVDIMAALDHAKLSHDLPITEALRQKITATVDKFGATNPKEA